MPPWRRYTGTSSPGKFPKGSCPQPKADTPSGIPAQLGRGFCNSSENKKNYVISLLFYFEFYLLDIKIFFRYSGGYEVGAGSQIQIRRAKVCFILNGQGPITRRASAMAPPGGEMGMTLGRPEILQLTSEKLAFGRASMEICRQGISRILGGTGGHRPGQEIPLEELCAFFFGMYNFIGGHFCTSLCLSLGPDGVVFGRNSDFAVALEPTNENSYYHLTDGNAFVGNSTAPSQMEDGVNCHGLAVGLTLIYPRWKRVGAGGGHPHPLSAGEVFHRPRGGWRNWAG